MLLHYLMKNTKTKYLFLSIITILFTSLSLAQEYPDRDALEIARSFFYGEATKTGQQETISMIYYSEPDVENPVSVFQKEEGGYLLLTKTGSEYIVTGYSPSGILTPGDMPGGLTDIIKTYESSEYITKTKLTSLTKATIVVDPLLDREGVSLNQYWHTEVGDCPTGCTATAMAQIMSFYKYPGSGTGNPCYNHPEYGTLCADIENTVYDWNNMTDADYELLSFHMAVAMKMDFCGHEEGSVPSSPDYLEVLEDYYSYHVRTGTTDLYYLLNELDNERPAYVSLPGDPGHAVVVDGYDSDGYCHVNFGWNGRYNGYFLLNTGSTLSAGSHEFGTNISVAAYVSKQVLPAHPDDSLALLALHNGFNETTGWNLSEPVMKWDGVLLMNGRVTELNLGQLTGTIASELGTLSMLLRLSLNGDLDGQLPSTVSTLTELRELTIFSGNSSQKITLPAELGNLANLKSINMMNSVEGEIPASIGNLANLEFLNLNSGNMTGIIPPEIGNLSKLRYLNLGNNSLTGNIPTEIQGLVSANTIDLSSNNLTGNIPVGTGNLTQLSYLYLQDNQLSGEVPGSLGNCTGIISMNLSDNMLTGILPEGLGDMNGMEDLSLGHNNFTSVPGSIGRLRKLKYLNLEYNDLESLPDSIINIEMMKIFRANNNNIESLPPYFGNWPDLEEIDLSHNKITSFPEELCLLPELWSIRLDNNRIKSLPAGSEIMSKVSQLFLDSNLISGPIPLKYLSQKLPQVDLRHNQFTYKDIPDSEILIKGISDQAWIKLETDTIKGREGDTLRIDIRDISPLSDPGNSYYWFEYPENIDDEYHDFMQGEEQNPVLTLVLNQETINKKYYCKVFNDNASSYTWEWDGGTYVTPVIMYLNTDTLSFAISSDDEILENKYPGNRIVSSDELPSKEITGSEVTMTSPFDLRGDITWQGSADGSQWYDISMSMQEQNILDNVISVSGEELVVSPYSPVYYRCVLTEGTCDPIISDSVRVMPMGEILFDDMINVSGDSLSVSVDSIKVILPEGLHEDDFRLTITKLDNPPSAEGVLSMGSAYDVTLSIGSIFEIPLTIKLKNIDVPAVDLLDLPAYKPVYYDDLKQEWKQYDQGGINLSDSTLEFQTTHLTKLSWWEISEGSYTHSYTNGKTEVIYKWGTGTGEENNYLGYQYGIENFPSEPWHDSNTDVDNGGTPAIVQDIAAYMNQIITKFESLSLQPAGSTFKVYLSNTGSGSLGHIHLGGYNMGYFTINSALATSPEDLRQTLAHEYMHYTQSRFMNVLTSNYFFAEAHAPLSDRIAWPAEEHEIPEPESHLRQSLRPGKGYKSIYDLLGSPWDAQTTLPVIEKRTVVPEDANLSSTFLHYMRTYRTGTKLDVAKLLKDHGTAAGITTATWRQYIDGQTTEQLGTKIGKEYDDYVRYLLSGISDNFTILNKEQLNPFSNIIRNSGSANNGSFARRKIYSFQEEDDTPVNEEINIDVPYLASKIMVLNNNTQDRPVVVNYTRLHDEGDNNKVYYGYYDYDNKIVEFKDISDSTSFSLLLDARSERTIRECRNTAFLLFVNTLCPDVLSYDNDFNASFELKAFPVINITDLAYANISDRNIHNYSDATKKEFIMPGLLNLSASGVFSEVVVSDYSTGKKMLGDSAYVVTASFIQDSRADNGPDLAANRYIFTRSQTIEYNFISGTIKITQDNNEEGIFEEYYSRVTDTYYPQRTFYTKTETHTLELKNVNEFVKQSYGLTGDIYEFETLNTSETQACLSAASHSASYISYNTDGEVDSSKTYDYLNTEYPDGDVKISLQLHYK